MSDSVPVSQGGATSALPLASFAPMPNNGSRRILGGSGGKSKKKRKTATDVNAPKKPVSAYIMYLNEKRERVKVENPTMTYPDILKMLAAEWSALGQDDRKKYQEEANKAREKYNQDVDRYKTTDLYKRFCEEQTLQMQHQQQQQNQQYQTPIHAPHQQSSQPLQHQQQQIQTPQLQQHQPPQHQPPQQQQNQLPQDQHPIPPQRPQPPHMPQLKKHLQASPHPFQQPQHQHHPNHRLAHQQILQQQHSAIPPSELKRQLSTEVPVRNPPSLVMVPNANPTPATIASPTFKYRNPMNQAPAPTPPPMQQPSMVMPSSTIGGQLTSVSSPPSSIDSSDPGHEDGSKRQSLTGNLPAVESVSQAMPKVEAVCSYDIPIFTEEFLEHNKNRETELRHLKKHNTQLEEQNAMLSKEAIGRLS